MRDHFEKLGVPRKPWLDSEELKAKFLAISAETHPDKASGAEKSQAEDEFKNLNEAYQTLRSSRSRLNHLLELAGLPKPSPVESLPKTALELFAPVATATKKADVLIKEKATANSPMLKVQWFQKGLDCVDELQELQRKLQERVAKVEQDLRELNASWASDAKNPALLRQLRDASAALGFLEKWSDQLQERAAALSF